MENEESSFDEIVEDFNFDNNSFIFDGLDNFDISSDVKLDRFAKVRKSTRISKFNYKYAKNLADELGDIGDGDVVHCLVEGSFIFGDFIEAFVTKNNYICDVSLSTLSYGKENVDSLKNLFLSGNLNQLQIITSDYFFSHERKSGVEYTFNEFSEFKFRMAATRSHTKITLIKTECGKHFVMQGSANLRSSANFEQFTIENNKELFRFYADWHNSLFEKYQIRHSLGVK